MVYTHGGDVFALGEPVLDFSISLNPLGMPPCAVEAARESLLVPAHYPDPCCRDLVRAIARRDGVEEGQVLCGNGASDLIDRLVRAVGPERALVAAPAFTEYEKFLKINHCKVDFHFTQERENFTLTERVLGEITADTGLVFLCDPGSPGGALLEGDLLRAVLARCRAVGALLAMDQCFLELTRADPRRLADELPGGGLVLLRALTKSFAMAGLRVGYCLSGERGLLERMEALSQPWAVSVPAQAAAAAALEGAPDWPSRCLDIVERERGRISAALERAGAKVYPSDTNFLLFRWRDEELKQKLLRRGILIRQCNDFRGLDGRYFRVSVRTREENDRLIQALGEV